MDILVYLKFFFKPANDTIRSIYYETGLSDYP